MGLMKSFCQMFLNVVEELLRFQGSPGERFEVVPEVDEVVDLVFYKFIDHVRSKIDCGYPPILDIIKPFFVIRIIGGVKIENVFTH